MADPKPIIGIEDVDPAIASLEQEGYMVEFLHIASGKMCMFPSWITDFSDSFTSEWSSETVFGRNDAIGVFRGTTRKISLSLSIPSFSVKEAHANMHQVEHLAALMYPSYRQYGGQDTIAAAPLLKVRWANLIHNANAKDKHLGVSQGGLACWIDSLSISFDMTAGFHHPSPKMKGADLAHYNYTRGGNKIRKNNNSHFFVPKIINFNVGLNVVHEHKLGWKGSSWMASGDDAFPYGFITLSGGEHHDKIRDGGKMTYRTSLKGKNANKEAMEKAYGGRLERLLGAQL